jgi:hypothetical protein
MKQSDRYIDGISVIKIASVSHGHHSSSSIGSTSSIGTIQLSLKKHALPDQRWRIGTVEQQSWPLLWGQSSKTTTIPTAESHLKTGGDQVERNLELL